METTSNLDSSSANIASTPSHSNISISGPSTESSRPPHRTTTGRNRTRRHEDNKNIADRSTRAKSGNWRRHRGDATGSSSTVAGPVVHPQNLSSLPSQESLKFASVDRDSSINTTSVTIDGSDDASVSTPPVPTSNHGRGPKSNRRGPTFIASLTESSEHSPSKSPRSSKGLGRYRPAAPLKDDLTSTLIHAISTPPYPDCLICFSAIHPANPTWSCSPSPPSITTSSGEVDPAQCCWTTFHLKCIRSWAAKSVKKVSDAWRARGEDRKGEWRCPGCRMEREAVPNEYLCFCGSMPEPKLTRLATPHSCANMCSRLRPCGHACPMPCHPGPCPPCQIVITKSCYCSKQTLTFKCCHLTPSKGASSTGPDMSCGAVCGKRLECRNHTCEKVCHAGDCDQCEVKQMVKCYCSKVDREVPCGEGEAVECVIDAVGDSGPKRWLGRFTCGNECNRPFDCGIHSCSKLCHPPSPAPPPCPRSPSQITHCPCGKHELSPRNISFFTTNTILPRTSCTDSIPTCESTCMKPLPDCGHVCSGKCHSGPCPPCGIMVVRPCRCGTTRRDVKCSTIKEHLEDEIMCDRPCNALRACGRHQCNRVCCPLASLAGARRGRGKKRGVVDQVEMGEVGLHECDLICGRMLSCGNHQCEDRDHRGTCPPCLRSGFDEVICHCGRTVLEPPIPCGTRINCVHQCMRPPPPCGHPRAPHSCHEEPSGCPPCPFLASKQCACGKKVMDNVRCSQEKVSCGTICGRLLGCGFHHCERLCHNDDCGRCSAPCGKARKHCLPEHHPCTLTCHAPSSCPELEPCRAVIALTCPCERIRQSVPCGKSASNPSGCEHTHQPKCNNECAVAKRNARLAEALGINPENPRNTSGVVFKDELISFARLNPKLLSLVEKAFADFISSDRKTQILPHMPADRRKFVLGMASVYRMDAQMLDQEPHRSVQLIRRIDTRIPGPLLSEVLASSSSSHGTLGKLANLRNVNGQSIRPYARSQIKSAAITEGSRRGWQSGTGGPTGQVVERMLPVTKPGPVLAQPQEGGDVPDDWEDDI